MAEKTKSLSWFYKMVRELGAPGPHRMSGIEDSERWDQIYKEKKTILKTSTGGFLLDNTSINIGARVEQSLILQLLGIGPKNRLYSTASEISESFSQVLVSLPLCLMLLQKEHRYLCRWSSEDKDYPWARRGYNSAWWVQAYSVRVP